MSETRSVRPESRRAECAGGALALICLLGTACGVAEPNLPDTTPLPTPPTPNSQPTNGNAPSARIGVALGFDPISRTLLMYGGAPATGTNLTSGHPATRLDETWSWDGTRWSRLHPKTSPPALFGARMIVDPDTQELLLVSGAGDLSGTALQQEGMWEWDGSTWSRIADNPVQVPFAAAGFDPVRNAVVLSGFDPAYASACLGCIPPPQYDQGGDYVFKKGASDWSTPPGDAPGWARAGTAYDPVSRRIISAAGAKQNGLQSTYAWDGSQWSQIIKPAATTSSPDPSQPQGPCDAATDLGAGRIVMACAPASGATGGATWTFDGKQWQSVSGADTPAIPSDASLANSAGVLTLAYDPALPAVVMVIGAASGTETMAAWNGGSWSEVPSS